MESKVKHDSTRYATLAGLFSYPGEDFGDVVGRVQVFLNDTSTEAAAELQPFTEYAEQATRIEIEELYTRSFDVQAVTTLDVGYVLFGDDYKRGELLVNLNREHREAGVDCGTELPDHLPNVLRLLDVIDKPDLRNELVAKIVGPAMRKIIGEPYSTELDAIASKAIEDAQVKESVKALASPEKLRLIDSQATIWNHGPAGHLDIKALKGLGIT